MKKISLPRIVFLLPRIVFLTLLLGLSAFASAGDWTRFQGPLPSDVDVSRLPMTWSPKENVAWTADITGYGQSSPVTFGERVFVTSISGPKKERCHVAASIPRQSQWPRSGR